MKSIQSGVRRAIEQEAKAACDTAIGMPELTRADLYTPGLIRHHRGRTVVTVGDGANYVEASGPRTEPPDLTGLDPFTRAVKTAAWRGLFTRRVP